MAAAHAAASWGIGNGERWQAPLGSSALSFAPAVLVFRDLREFEPIYWTLPLMGFAQMAVYAVDAIAQLELFPPACAAPARVSVTNGGRIVAASAPFTICRHPPLPE